MIFQVTNTNNNRITFNAAHVIGIIEKTEGCSIVTAVDTITVQESYRSVRGYVKKAYATVTTPVAENEEE